MEELKSFERASKSFEKSYRYKVFNYFTELLKMANNHGKDLLCNDMQW